MYILERNDGIFEIRHELVFQASTIYKSIVNSLLHSEYKEIWEEFVNSRNIQSGILPENLAKSWMRCIKHGVNPQAGRCESFASLQEIQLQADWYTEFASELERQVFAQIRQKNLLMTVTDASGHILRTCGDKNTLKEADNLHFGPSAQWSEESVGTNAISLALQTREAVQLLGEAHFCSDHHSWGCTAAPIFTPFGDLWGCFDISGPLSSDHSKTMKVVMIASKAVERLLLHDALAEMEQEDKNLLSSLLDTRPVGILIANPAGIITFSNNISELLLNTKETLRDKKLSTFFKYSPSLGLASEEISLTCLSNTSLKAKLTPLLTNNSPKRRGYSLITLQLSSHDKKNLYIVQGIEKPSAKEDAFSKILYVSDPMNYLINRAKLLAKSNAPLHIYGETGTGKELFARAVHKASSCASAPFIAVNCGSLPENLIQSLLFGHEKGSFTGAATTHIGFFEQARGGTLFLDEISEMPLEMQVNLLRPLEEHVITRVGGKKEISVNFRLITASNKNIKNLISTGKFREDLFFRIHVLSLSIPALRNRKPDILFIAESYCASSCASSSIPFTGFSPEVKALLENYTWSGNVRELIHAMEYALSLFSGGEILPQHLPDYLLNQDTPKIVVPSQKKENQAEVQQIPSSQNKSFNLEEVESQTILSAYQHYNGNIKQIATALGIGRNTLYAKLKKIHNK